MNILRYSLVFSALASALFFHSCGGDVSQNKTPETGGTPEKGDWVIIRQISDPEGLNPLTTGDIPSRNVSMRIFEPLLALDFETAKLRPILAEALPAVSEDHLTYTFSLKKNITFSDGKPLTAKDILFTFKTVKNPLIVDAAALRNYFIDLADVQIQDDYTIVFRMSKPYFMADYSIGGVWIMPKHIFDPKNLTDQYSFAETNDISAAQNSPSMKEFAEWFGAAERKREPKYMIGSGPYKAEEWRTNEFISIVRNERYWNAGNDPDAPAYLDKILFKTVNDNNSAVVALKNQEIDFIDNVVPPKTWVEDIDTASLPHIHKQKYVIPAYTYIGWNCRKPYFSDKLTRKALSHLIDRDLLIRQVNLGFGQPQNTVLYKMSPEYDPTLPAYEHNPQKAKDLLKESGWKDSNGDGILDKMINGVRVDFSFVFLVNAGNEVRENIAVLASEEMKKVGIKAEVRKLEWSVFLENVRTHSFDACILSWVNDPTPSDPYQIWHSSQAVGKGSNYIGFINARVDDLLNKNRTEFDESKRVEYMKEFQRIIHDEQPYTVLWLSESPAAYNARLRNLTFSSPRPGYNPARWFVPASLQKYTQGQ